MAFANLEGELDLSLSSAGSDFQGCLVGTSSPKASKTPLFSGIHKT
jgi:hypothetical protein